MVILDFSVSPNPTTMANMIQSAAAICQQSPMCAVLVRYPLRITSQAESSWIASTRKIEDRLLTGGLCILGLVNAVIDTREAHGNDRRDAVVQFRLCVPEAFVESSPWMTSQVMNQHKIIQGVHMLPPRDLRFIPQADAVARKEHLNAQERGSQLGPKACEQILLPLMMGRASGEVRTRKVIVMDINPTFGDWLDASWNLHQRYLQGGDVPMVVYCTRYTASDVSEFNGMRSRTQQMLMEQWWESHPDAGPEEPVCTAESAVTRPSLTLLSWTTDGSKVTFPEILESKLNSDSEYSPQWKSACDNARVLLEKLEAANTHCSGRTVGNDVGAVALTGPDLDGAQPKQFNSALNLESVKLADFNLDDVQLG